MAASNTLSHPFALPQISKLGVLMLYGFGIRVTMQAGHLQTESGIGPDRLKLRLPRVGHRLKRLVCVGEDGFVTLSALRWLSDVGASFVMLDRLGKVRVVTGPTSASEAKLRRAQALAPSNGTAIRIARELITAKLSGQEALVRDELKNSGTAKTIAAFRDCLSQAESIDAIRLIEARAAAAYWTAWHDVPILFPGNDAKRIPQHWLRFGTRCSPLSGGPRLAINPPNSVLNFVNAVAQSECRLAASTHGLDPGLGLIHTDTASRDSLSLDLIETIRPAIEAWLLDWLRREPFRGSEFSENPNGNCRVSSDLCSKLAETAPIWGKLVAPWAEYVAHSLWSGTSQRRKFRRLKTPLTQMHRRSVKGSAVPEVQLPKLEHQCRGCGESIRTDTDHCAHCALPVTRRNFAKGRRMAHGPESLALRSKSNQAQAEQVKNWKAEQLPTWLTRECYLSRVVPALGKISKAQIRAALGVSIPYSIWIQRGERVPHVRHWQALAKLAGVQM